VEEDLGPIESEAANEEESTHVFNVEVEHDDRNNANSNIEIDNSDNDNSYNNDNDSNNDNDNSNNANDNSNNATDPVNVTPIAAPVIAALANVATILPANSSNESYSTPAQHNVFYGTVNIITNNNSGKRVRKSNTFIGSVKKGKYSA